MGGRRPARHHLLLIRRNLISEIGGGPSAWREVEVGDLEQVVADVRTRWVTHWIQAELLRTAGEALREAALRGELPERKISLLVQVLGCR